MDVPSAVLAIVLAEAAVGGLAVLWAAPTWGAVRHGYEILLGSTLALIAWGAWASLRGPVGNVARFGADPEVVSAATWAGHSLLVLTVLAGLSVLALLARRPPVARALGVLSVLAGVASLVLLALARGLRGAPGGFVQGLAELLLGALLLGAVWDGLILGHWYLVERRLSPRYMSWMARVNVAAALGGLVAVLLSARNPVPCVGATGAELELCALQFSPLLTVGGITILMGLGTIALVGFIAAVNVRLAREGGRSIQAATGMSYLAVILAPAAELAAKVRFF